MKSKTPKHDAAVAWLSQAKKGEVHVYWEGNLDRACNNPEQNLSNEQRRKHSAACRAAKKAGKPTPKCPDPFRAIRDDARAIREWSEYQEVRGLVELRTIVMGKDRRYEMQCLVQRNGLAAVRARK